jgi:hypothetical protein
MNNPFNEVVSQDCTLPVLDKTPIAMACSGEKHGQFPAFRKTARQNRRIPYEKS